MVDKGTPHAPPEPKGSPRRVCIDSGGTWNEDTQKCEFRKELQPGQIAQANEVIITDAQGVQRVQTPETLKQAKTDIAILGAGVGAKQLIQEQEAQQEAQQAIDT